MWDSAEGRMKKCATPPGVVDLDWGLQKTKTEGQMLIDKTLLGSTIPGKEQKKTEAKKENK